MIKTILTITIIIISKICYDKFNGEDRVIRIGGSE